MRVPSIMQYAGGNNIISAIAVRAFIYESTGVSQKKQL